MLSDLILSFFLFLNHILLLSYQLHLQGARVIEAIDELFNTWESREAFEVIDSDKDIRKIQTHNLVY